MICKSFSSGDADLGYSFYKYLLEFTRWEQKEHG